MWFHVLFYLNSGVVLQAKEKDDFFTAVADSSGVKKLF